MQRGIKRALQEYKGSILIVCHEPEFYEGLATDIWDFSSYSLQIETISMIRGKRKFFLPLFAR